MRKFVFQTYVSYTGISFYFDTWFYVLENNIGQLVENTFMQNVTIKLTMSIPSVQYEDPFFMVGKMGNLGSLHSLEILVFWEIFLNLPHYQLL